MARATRKSRTTALAFDALSVEGALIAPAMLARIAEQNADGQAESDYNVPKGLALRDEIARYFRIGQALFTDLRARSLPEWRDTSNVFFGMNLVYSPWRFGLRSQRGRQGFAGRTIARPVRASRSALSDGVASWFETRGMPRSSP